MGFHDSHKVALDFNIKSNLGLIVIAPVIEGEVNSRQNVKHLEISLIFFGGGGALLNHSSNIYSNGGFTILSFNYSCTFNFFNRRNSGFNVSQEAIKLTYIFNPLIMMGDFV